jgi:hypothetical protein
MIPFTGRGGEAIEVGYRPGASLTKQDIPPAPTLKIILHLLRYHVKVAKLYLCFPVSSVLKN